MSGLQRTQSELTAATALLQDWTDLACASGQGAASRGQGPWPKRVATWLKLLANSTISAKLKGHPSNRTATNSSVWFCEAGFPDFWRIAQFRLALFQPDLDIFLRRANFLSNPVDSSSSACGHKQFLRRRRGTRLWNHWDKASWVAQFGKCWSLLEVQKLARVIPISSHAAP